MKAADDAKLRSSMQSLRELLMDIDQMQVDTDDANEALIIAHERLSDAVRHIKMAVNADWRAAAKEVTP